MKESNTGPHVLANFPMVKPVQNPLAGVNRNGPCPCGSGKKWKKCCLGQERDARRIALLTQDGQQQGLRDELTRLEAEEIRRVQEAARIAAK